MKILVVSPFVPFPPKFGGAQRIFHLLSHWSKRHEIDLVAHPLGEPEAEVRAGLEGIIQGLHLVAPKRGAKPWSQVRALIGRRPWQYYRHYDPALQAVLDGLPRDRYDLVVVEFSQTLYHRVGHLAKTVVLDAHNVESTLLERSLRHRPDWQKPMARREAARFRADEKRLLNTVDGVLVTSGTDGEQIAALAPGRPLQVVPNGIEPADWPRRAGARTGQTILFVGSLDYLPNRDAALRLATAIFPRVQKRLPGARVQIVGATPPPDVAKLGEQPGVSVHASVPEVRPFYDGADVFACPLRSGSGTRLKLLEAAAAELPIVATPIAAEGLDLIPGEHLRSARTDAAFASALVECLTAREAASRRAEAARELVFHRYGWARAARSADEFFQRICSKAPFADPSPKTPMGALP
ncbi:MAG: glycosyltransferase [Planctomycetota bacterium]